MIYIKYTNTHDPTKWSIWAHEKGSKKEIMILDASGSTYPHEATLDVTYYKTRSKVKYLTKEEVEREIDLIKLELL